MEYRQLGQYGVRVSPICLGTAFRSFWAGDTDEKTCARIIEKAVDLGINFIDCANYYFSGRCEEIVGKVLSHMKSRRDDLVITSKVWSNIGPGPNAKGASRFHILREIERSLKRMNIDHIDLYLLHHFDPTTPLEETLSTMNDLVRSGKVRYFGMCNYTAAQIVEALWVADKNRYTTPACLQNEYNLICRSNMENELIERCSRHGLGMMTYSPLAVGLLTGKFRRGVEPPIDSLWGKDLDRYRHVMTRGVNQVINVLIDIAGDLGKTPAQVAFAWILDHPEITAAITGPDKAEHVEEVCGGVGWKLPPELRKRLDEVSSPENITQEQ